MFSTREATAMIPAHDLERAKRWYKDKLGIEPVEVMEWGAAYSLGGGLRAFLYQTEFAGSARHTLLSFSCEDLLADMKAMREKGVVFEDYDLPDLKTVDGLADFGSAKNAWAKDSEGNILGFVEGL